MDATERSVLKTFASNPRASGAVYNLLLRNFLKPQKGHDVHALAASRIAIDLLQDAWRDLESFKTDKEERPERKRNPGY